VSGPSAGTGRRAFDATVKPVYVAVRGLGGRVLDRWYGIRTTGEVQLADLGLGAADRNRYKATEWTTLPRILPRREVAEHDVFIDFGSGLGRVVHQAAHYPFRRVIGVELSETLSEVARANIERGRHRLRCQDVEIVTADAVEYDVPDDVTVAFFANPFTGRVFATVIEHLLTSVDRRPRRLRLIYRCPTEHEYLMETGRFRLVRVARGWRPGREWSRSNATWMYEVTPAALGSS
jgi:Histone methylation protein DOT1